MNPKPTLISTIDSATAKKSIQSKPNPPTNQGGKKKQLTESIKRCLPITLGLASNQLMLSLLLLFLSLTFSISLPMRMIGFLRIVFVLN